MPGERLEVRLLWNHGRLAAEPSSQMFAVFHFLLLSEEIKQIP